jgi:hypothetical protein
MLNLVYLDPSGVVGAFWLESDSTISQVAIGVILE